MLDLPVHLKLINNILITCEINSKKYCYFLFLNKNNEYPFNLKNIYFKKTIIVYNIKSDFNFKLKISNNHH